MRIGVFGGTFDPIHNAHLFMAQLVMEAAGLERVVFVPASHVHHRDAALSSEEHRCAMIRLAIAANPHFALDPSDLAAEASGYTADLIPRLQARYPGDALSFIAGADSLLRSTWKRLDEVLDHVERFYVVMRGELEEREVAGLFAGFSDARRARVEIIPGPRLTASATLVRERLRERRSVRYLVPEPVFRYIEEHDPYGSALHA